LFREMLLVYRVRFNSINGSSYEYLELTVSSQNTVEVNTNVYTHRVNTSFTHWQIDGRQPIQHASA